MCRMLLIVGLLLSGCSEGLVAQSGRDAGEVEADALAAAGPEARQAASVDTDECVVIEAGVWSPNTIPLPSNCAPQTMTVRIDGLSVPVSCWWFDTTTSAVRVRVSARALSDSGEHVVVFACGCGDKASADAPLCNWQ